jgi:hypothetical protein
MNRIRQLLREEDGIAMAMTVMMIAVLALLSVTLIDRVGSESTEAASSATSDAVYQAAEAGVNDYIAKLTEDPQYYDHCVAKGEETRKRADTGALVGHSVDTDSCKPGGASVWKAGVAWTYPSPRSYWFDGTNSGTVSTVIRGYAYNLMIAPPSKTTGTTYITIVSTGCKVVDPDATVLTCAPSVPKRAIEVHVRRTTPADFQYMMTDMHNSNVCWASNIYGKMYSTGDIKVCGAHAYGDMMAEGHVTGSPLSMMNGARVYDLSHPDIRTVVKDPISFSDFFVSVSDIQRAADLNSPSTDFNDPTASAWRIIFTSDGTMRVWKCTNTQGDAASYPPYCNDVRLSSTYTLPKSGGITINLNESSASFPNASSTSPKYAYVGTSPGVIDQIKYTGKGTNTLTGVTCPGCPSGGRQHLSGETVSYYPAGSQPGFTPYYVGPLPSNGAVYTEQDAVISWPTAINNGYVGDGSSVLNGRVGVASGSDVVVAGNIQYASASDHGGIGGPDDDVLGLIAENNFWLGSYAPSVLWFRAATIALTGLWGDYRCSYGGGSRGGSSSSLTFVGTSAYYSNGGCILSTSNGGYGYIDTDSSLKNVYRITDDGTASECPTTAPGCTAYDALKFLFPPWFPVINGMETTVLFREVPPDFMPDLPG